MFDLIIVFISLTTTLVSIDISLLPISAALALLFENKNVPPTKQKHNTKEIVFFQTHFKLFFLQTNTIKKAAINTINNAIPITRKVCPVCTAEPLVVVLPVVVPLFPPLTGLVDDLASVDGSDGVLSFFVLSFSKVTSNDTDSPAAMLSTVFLFSDLSASL